MRSEDFWALIDESARVTDSKEDRTAWLVDTLAGRPAEDMVAFQRQFEELVARAGTEDIRDAAWILGAGLLLDDEFGEFRVWLIGQGRQIYEQVVAEPDTLTTIPPVRRLMGRPIASWDDEEWPEWEVLRRLTESMHSRMASETAQGWRATDAAAMARRLPQLSAMFPRER
ncbi:DUF4240 domain-containing protein [Symbioplanes lichenis]|uniref:DUF4240 domain-containing protein n=1 Tax=Symbioplanes lichenis TaxID=1629072 RepID=UPI0027394473|nr:DUF4240 domain-containing protein [Actinoplanes lichenis]